MSDNIKSLKNDGQNGYSAITGLGLIVIGALLFVMLFAGINIPSTQGTESIGGFTNWWAIFSVLPLMYFIYGAWHNYQKHNEVTSVVKGNLIGGGAVLFGMIFAITSFSTAILFPMSFMFAGFVILVSSR